MQNFRDVLDHCEFVDLRYFGPNFTWHGKQKGKLIWERLDRGVANYEWLTCFRTGRVKHLNCFTSDHRPLLLSLDGDNEYQRWRKKPFRFEAMWILDLECKKVVARVWDCAPNGTPMFAATTKLKRCKKRLKSWSRVHFGNVKQQMKQAKDQLWHAEEVSARTGDLEEVIRIKMELNALFDKEEKMWQQRFKVQWLKNGDQNTKFSWDCHSKEEEKFY